MDPRRVTDALLFVIAICLVLIVAHLYGLGAVTSAEAQPKPGPGQVELVYRGADDDYHPVVDGHGQIRLAGSPQH
jgi:hypothetical protein